MGLKSYDKNQVQRQICVVVNLYDVLLIILPGLVIPAT